MKQMVEGVRAAEAALRNPVSKEDTRPVAAMKQVFEKSIVAAMDIPAGTVVSDGHLTCKKPGGGLPPRIFDQLMGKKLRRPVKYNERVREEDFA